MIELKTLSKSIEEAERFIESAKILKGLYLKYPEQTWYHAPKYSVRAAACKRASMDLTRTLADLRQGG